VNSLSKPFSDGAEPAGTTHGAQWSFSHPGGGTRRSTPG
jgi:hypothetical protein